MHSHKVCICTKRGRDYTLGWLQLVRGVAKQGKRLYNVLAMQRKHCGLCIMNVYRESLVRMLTCITKYCSFPVNISVHVMHEIQQGFKMKGYFGYGVVPDAQYTCSYLLLELLARRRRPGTNVWLDNCAMSHQDRAWGRVKNSRWPLHQSRGKDSLPLLFPKAKDTPHPILAITALISSQKTLIIVHYAWTARDKICTTWTRKKKKNVGKYIFHLFFIGRR